MIGFARSISRDTAVEIRYVGNRGDNQWSALIYNSIRVAYGAGAVITGAVFLAIGLKRKKALQEWKKQRFRASVAPAFGSRGVAASAQLSFRF